MKTAFIGLDYIFDIVHPDGKLAKGAGHALDKVAALKKCTDGIKFESDKYVNCMTKEGENP